MQPDSKIAGILRHLATTLAGVLVAWAAKRGLSLDAETTALVLTALLSGGYGYLASIAHKNKVGEYIEQALTTPAGTPRAILDSKIATTQSLKDIN